MSLKKLYRYENYKARRGVCVCYNTTRCNFMLIVSSVSYWWVSEEIAQQKLHPGNQLLGFCCWSCYSGGCHFCWYYTDYLALRNNFSPSALFQEYLCIGELWISFELFDIFWCGFWNGRNFVILHAFNTALCQDGYMKRKREVSNHRIKDIESYAVCKFDIRSTPSFRETMGSIVLWVSWFFF